MKIGFLDYQLNNYHNKKFHSILSGPVGQSLGSPTVACGWELSPTDEGKAWCEENGIRYCTIAQEVFEQCDALLVLAPNNPELHLQIAAPALATGKPVFIDKMLASSSHDAREIVRLAEQSQSPLFSSSSLRFAEELKSLPATSDASSVFARGLGSFSIYSVHTLALGLRFFGPDWERVIDTGRPGAHCVTIQQGGRRLVVDVRESENQYEATPWQVGFLSENRYHFTTITQFDTFYENLMREVVAFFQTRQSPLSMDDMIATVAIQEAAARSLQSGGEWISNS